MSMCKNVGVIDRTIRAIVGVVALVLAFVALGVMTGAIAGIIAAVVGVVMLGTAAMGICPLYVPFKLSTCNAASR